MKVEDLKPGEIYGMNVLGTNSYIYYWFIKFNKISGINIVGKYILDNDTYVLKENEIYHVDIGEYIWLVRITKYHTNCSALAQTSRSFRLKFYDFSNTNDFIYRKVTEEEKMWFEYCESVGEYREKEEALDYSYAMQFVEQYLTEE